MGVGEFVVSYLAKLLGPRTAAQLFNPAGGIGQHADVDAVLVHDIEILVVIESMQPGAARIVFRLREQFKILLRKCVKVRVDDHGAILRYAT